LEISANRSNLVGPFGAESADCAGAFAGDAPRSATVAKLSHNRTFDRMGMGFIPIAPENELLLGTPDPLDGRLAGQTVSAEFQLSRTSHQ
jgi:hypothetical protein